MIWRIALAAWLTLLLAVVGQQSHAQFNGCSAGFCSRVAGGVVATTTWSSSDKSANLALSPGNLIFTQTLNNGTYSNIRTVASASSGKKYWEMTATTVATVASSGSGIGDASASLSSFLGADTHGLGWTGDGRILNGGANIGSVQTWVQGDVLCYAMDITGNLIWFRTIHLGTPSNWNNNGSADPGTGVGGFNITGLIASPPIFAIGSAHELNDAYTGNFGATAYAQTVPSGFGNW